jgi:segregation and condensation protein A
MNEETGNPFWASPPYILLTDVLQLDKVEPWNVDVGKLVSGFLDEMKRLGDIDFRISGSALYSASVIFMKKTRDLVELGILPPEEEDDDEEIEIPMIHPPFRLSNRRVTLQELLVAMDKVLSKGVRKRSRPRSKASERTQAEPLQFKMDSTRANIEETIAEVLEDLRRIMDIGETVKFTDIILNNTRKEIVRVFFSLLHLYARAFIDIWDDEEGYIWLRLLEPPEEEREELLIEEGQLQLDF